MYVYGVEIKRPTSSDAVVSALDDALELLAAHWRGGVVFEISECVAPQEMQ